MTEIFITIISVMIGWIIGAFIAKWIMGRFFTKEEVISDDDVLDFDKSERPYIPVRILKQQGQYYAWFSGNDKFIGQSKSVQEIHKMAHEHVFKQMGLRFEFTQETDTVKPKPQKIA